MGSLFDGGTKEVQQQATTTPLATSEVNRLSSITGQQQKAALKKRAKPATTVLGAPIQPVGNPAASVYGLNNG